MTRSVLLRGLLALLVVTAGTTVKANNAVEEATHEVLDIIEDPTQYNSLVMPVNSSDVDGPVVVKTQMYLRNVEVNDYDMTTTVEMTFRMLWTDERITYVTPGVEYVTLLDAYKIWLPDPFFKNAISTTLSESVHPEAYIRITKDGSVTYSTRLRLVLRCNMDLSRFPHDEQTCPILVASYGYKITEILLEMDGDVIIDDDLIYQSRFTFAGREVSSCNSVTTTGEYSCVQVDLSLDRVSSTYSMELYIPCIFLVIVAFFSEVIPAGALLPRLLLTLVPLITLASFTFAYSLSLPAVPYARASDIFDGISLLVIFATLIHTIVAYYRSLLDVAEKRLRDAEGGEGTQPNILSRCLAVVDTIFLVFILLFYVLFLVIYFAMYC